MHVSAFAVSVPLAFPGISGGATLVRSIALDGALDGPRRPSMVHDGSPWIPLPLPCGHRPAPRIRHTPSCSTCFSHMTAFLPIQCRAVLCSTGLGPGVTGHWVRPSHERLIVWSLGLWVVCLQR